MLRLLLVPETIFVLPYRLKWNQTMNATNDPAMLRKELKEAVCSTPLNRALVLDPDPTRRRPHGKQEVLNYLELAFDELRGRTDANRVWAEVGYLWLSGEACVLLWESGEAVALANVRSNPEREFTSCHFITEMDIVLSVKGMRVFPGLASTDGRPQ